MRNTARSAVRQERSRPVGRQDAPGVTTSLDASPRRILLTCFLDAVGLCDRGGTGRRAGLRILWGNPWGFESLRSHLQASRPTSTLQPFRASPPAGWEPVAPRPDVRGPRLTAAIAPQQHAVLINQRHADALELIGAELGGFGHVVGFAVPQWGSTPAAISDLASGPLPLALVAPAPVAPVGLPLSWPPDRHAVRPVASSSATTAPQTIRPAPAGPG